MQNIKVFQGTRNAGMQYVDSSNNQKQRAENVTKFLKGEHWSKMIFYPHTKWTIRSIFDKKLDKNKNKVPTCTLCSCPCM